MATIKEINVQGMDDGIILSIMFGFKTTKEYYYRSIKLGKNSTPEDVAVDLRRLADQIYDNEGLKTR